MYKIIKNYIVNYFIIILYIFNYSIKNLVTILLNSSEYRKCKLCAPFSKIFILKKFFI